LKEDAGLDIDEVIKVSNPWREAIEAHPDAQDPSWGKVSNPWREAIEGMALGRI